MGPGEQGQFGSSGEGSPGVAGDRGTVAGEIIRGRVWESCFPDLWPRATRRHAAARRDIIFGVFSARRSGWKEKSGSGGLETWSSP